MSQIVIVREKKCEGCLYSPNALDRAAAESRKYLKDDPKLVFTCHCFTGNENVGSAVCRGFFDAHPERLPNSRFTKKKGQYWQRFLRVPKGTMMLNKKIVDLISAGLLLGRQKL